MFDQSKNPSRRRPRINAALEGYIHIQKEEAQVLTNLCDVVNAWATAKGWNDKEDSITHKAEQIALMHSELSECLEFLRKPGVSPCPHCGWAVTTHKGIDLDQGHIWGCVKCGQEHVGLAPSEIPQMDDHCPSLTGEAAELADVLIRIFHYCGKRGIDLGHAVLTKHEYNISRPYRHGKNI